MVGPPSLAFKHYDGDRDRLQLQHGAALATKLPHKCGKMEQRPPTRGHQPRHRPRDGSDGTPPDHDPSARRPVAGPLRPRDRVITEHSAPGRPRRRPGAMAVPHDEHERRNRRAHDRHPDHAPRRPSEGKGPKGAGSADSDATQKRRSHAAVWDTGRILPNRFVGLTLGPGVRNMGPRVRRCVRRRRLAGASEGIATNPGIWSIVHLPPGSRLALRMSLGPEFALSESPETETQTKLDAHP